jgi:TolA-binding protein
MEVTIIIPTRDQNTSVIECVHALEHNDADIIVVDDASETPTAVPPNLARVIRHDRRRGRSACINTGLSAGMHDCVLIMDDDIYAAPDMVQRLLSEFTRHNNPKLGLKARVMWDPDVQLTITMKWMEYVGKFRSPMMLSRSFVLENGGYDENFTRRLEDTELQFRLAQRGLAMRQVEAAVGFQHNLMRIQDLAERELMEGVSAVLLHAKFPQCMPQVDDIEMLLKNEAQAADIEIAIEDIALVEQSESFDIPTPTSELYAHVCRHYFLQGILEGLRDIGGMKPRPSTSSTSTIYRQASHLQEIGDLDEARRLFRLVLHRPDEQYWDGAEYHLGCIEAELGNPAPARAHLLECLRLNPTHYKARRALNRPVRYVEVESNVFESIQPEGPSKVLLIVLGDLGHVVNAFPVMRALRNKFGETAWLTSPEHAALARASLSGPVHETESRTTIPWSWIYAEGFTHVFFPEPGANHEEWEQSGLHAIDFMAKKCGVEIETYRSRLDPGAEALSKAEKFLEEHGLTRHGFITASHGDGELRHWPNSNLMMLANEIDLPMVVFGRRGAPDIPGTIACLNAPPDVIATLIQWSCVYLGPAYGTSWLATTTDAPVVVFFDPRGHNRRRMFRDILQGEKDNIQEWDIYASLPKVLEFVESTCPQAVTSLRLMLSQYQKMGS